MIHPFRQQRCAQRRQAGVIRGAVSQEDWAGELDITTRTAGQAEIIEFRDRFDAHATHDATRALDAAITRKSPVIVINLQAVDFIDSAAMATLVRAMKRSREQGSDLYLCSLQRPVRLIFELTRLDRTFTIFSNEEEAIEALATR